MKACVWAHGELRHASKAREITLDSDLVIAADGGAQHLFALGLTPHIIVGDMDSIEGGVWAAEPEIEHLSVSEDERMTDTERAVELAFERGCDQVALLAAVGGTMDHTLGNISLVVKYPGRVAIVDGDSTLVAIDEYRKFRLHGKPGQRVSLIPFGKTVERIRTIGLERPIEEQDLVCGTRGIGNRLAGAECCICTAGGVLLAYAQQ